MQTHSHRTEGSVDVGPGRVRHESAGSGSPTLLLLHGGPGGMTSLTPTPLPCEGEGSRFGATLGSGHVTDHRQDKSPSPLRGRGAGVRALPARSIAGSR